MPDSNKHVIKKNVLFSSISNDASLPDQIHTISDID